MLKKQVNNNWAKISEIPMNTVFMMSGALKFMMQEWPERGLGNKVSKYFTLYKGDESWMCYQRKEFDKQCKFLADKMIENPKWALNIINNVEDWSSKFFINAKILTKLKLHTLSNQNLIVHFKRTLKYHTLSHGVGSSISWNADADKELVTQALLKMVSEQIKKQKLQLSPMKIFPILSTPKEMSMVENEEHNFLKLAEIIYKNKKVRETFIQSDLDWLTSELKSIDQKIYIKIIGHYKKYAYIPYQYRGPGYSLEDFIGRWQALLREGTQPQKMLNKLIKNKKSILQKQTILMKKIKFNAHQTKLIDMAKRMVFIKDYRKMALYHGMYCYEFLFKEISKRLGLSLEQVRAMTYWEIIEAILNNKFEVNELNARLKLCVDYVTQNKYEILSGLKAKNFLDRIKWEKIEVGKINELSGTCACAGKVKGRVKIVNLPNDMSKMKKGDIMVSFQTNPNLVPAMKKAGALIGEAGGLTCHTAIVARELNIPAIVGVDLVTKILKDGDIVEVDATKGVVRKINK